MQEKSKLSCKEQFTYIELFFLSTLVEDLFY